MEKLCQLTSALTAVTRQENLLQQAVLPSATLVVATDEMQAQSGPRKNDPT